MKKAALFCVAVFAALSVTASCGNPAAPPPAASVSQDASASVPDPARSGETPPVTMAGSGALGDCYVSIDACRLTQDVGGAPAAVVTFEWTNDGDKPASFMVALNAAAFQDGVQCDFAVLSGNGGQNSGAFMREIEPGASLSVQYAYSLRNDTSPVEVRVTQMFSFEADPPAVTRTFDIS